MNASDQRTESLWLKEARDGGFWPLVPKRRLEANLHCDTVIVGGGMAGLSIAYELATAGHAVVLVDRGTICGGMTSRTTAHLAPICDDSLDGLIGMRGEESARLFHRSQAAAVDHIETIVGRLGLECGFRRLDGYLFPALDASAEEAEKQIAREYRAAGVLGIAAERVSGIPLAGREGMPALRYPRQATMHPLLYARGLAQAFLAAGGKLFSDSAVKDVVEEAGGVRLEFDGDLYVFASRAVVATNAPVNNVVTIHSKMAPYRTYAMAFDVAAGLVPDALFWDTADPYHYVRLQGAAEGDRLVVGGEDHKSGEADDGAARFEALERWIRGLVPDLGGEVARWSGQILETVDYCGYIGRNPGSDNIWVATGDSGQGMTHGALAGLLLKQLILGEQSPWTDVYEPSRKTVSGALNYLKENMTAFESFTEYLTPGQLDRPEDLQPGQGGILRRGLKKIAACRDAAGVLHLLSATCTHLGCVVHWNSTEQCWDCPCHGSQFAPDGAVLNGPAVRPLDVVKEPVEQG